MIILIPKTESRALPDEVTPSKLLANRVGDRDIAEKVRNQFKGKLSRNMKKVGSYFNGMLV